MTDSHSTLDDEVDDYDGEDYSPERADALRAALKADLRHSGEFAGEACHCQCHNEMA